MIRKLNLDVWKQETKELPMPTVKVGSMTMMYHVNILKKYISREPEVDVVHTSNKNDATLVVAGLIYEDTDPKLGEVTDLEGFDQKEGV